MRVTYLYHSGFAVELEEEALVFDYYRGELPDLGGTRLTVFVSHSHPDHYNPAIFSWRKSGREVTYVLSDSVREKAVRRDAGLGTGSPGEAGILRLGAHTDQRVGNLRVQTLRSNDEGLAFLVTAGDTRIYHAGDLNWWHWEGEPEEDNAYMERSYREELERLGGLLGRHRLDAAFLVLDPRQEGQFYYGFDAFMRQVGARHAIPMHMWDSYEVIGRLKAMDVSSPYRGQIAEIERPGMVCLDTGDAR